MYLGNLKLFILYFIQHVTLTRVNVVKYSASQHQLVLLLCSSHVLEGQICTRNFDATISSQNRVRPTDHLAVYLTQDV